VVRVAVPLLPDQNPQLVLLASMDGLVMRLVRIVVYVPDAVSMDGLVRRLRMGWLEELVWSLRK
jgi:hypothetical protein